MTTRVTIRSTPDAVCGADVRSVAGWREAGITDAQRRALTRSGDLVLVRRGVYATRTAVTRAETYPEVGHMLGAIAATCVVGRGVPSHQTAALIHGLDLLEQPADGVVHLTMPRDTRSGEQGSAGIVRHPAALPDEHVVTVYGGKVTSVARTVADLARSVGFMEAVVIADSALRAQRASTAEMKQVIEACAGWRGTAQARRVVEFSDMFSESALESCARVIFHERGLEPAVLQYPILNPRGLLARVDFCWPDYKVIAEADGLSKYEENPRQKVAEQTRRDNELRRLGYIVIHFTWGELFQHPEKLVADILEAMHRNGRQRALR
jgi:hypothetical protein